MPSSLRPTEQAQLFQELIDLPSRGRWYETLDDSEPCQGDGWEKVDFVDLAVLERRQIRVVIVSNTCDTAPENKRLVPINFSLCPLVRLSRFVNLLNEAGATEDRIESIVSAVKRQDVSNIFYFPKGADLDDEYIIRFDDLQTQHPSVFYGNPAKRRVFSLSQAAFWLFLVKLSNHLCRSGEGVRRDKTSAR